MSRKNNRPQEAIAQLREAEVLLSHGTEAADGSQPHRLVASQTGLQ